MGGDFRLYIVYIDYCMWAGACEVTDVSTSRKGVDPSGLLMLGVKGLQVLLFWRWRHPKP